MRGAKTPRAKTPGRVALFLQTHRETTVHFTAIGMSAQQQCDSFRFRRAAFYNGLKSKVGLAAAKTTAMRINLNIDGCGVVTPPVHSSLRAPLLLSNLLSHNLPLPEREPAGPIRALIGIIYLVRGKRGLVTPSKV